MKAPEAPTGVMAEPGDGMLTVTWEKPNNDGGSVVTGYSVRYQQVGGTWTTADKTATAREATVTGLANDVEHHVQVAAMNAVGMGAYSASVMATPMAMDPEPEPEPTPTPTPALPLFGVLALGAGLAAAGRNRLRARRLLKK